jgi:hypothetical protein
MASIGSTRRRINFFSFASSIPEGAGPYEQVFISLKKKAPFETEGAFQKVIRVNHVEKLDHVWLIELYLIIDRLDFLEVSAAPVSNDRPTFVIPPEQRSFASRTCALFDVSTKICAIEYVRSGPKMIDFAEVLSREAYRLTKKQGTHFAISPLIEENFIREIDQFERIRQVRVVFERPNPGWGDIGILSDEVEGSGDARREVVISAPRSGSINKNKGLLKFVKGLIRAGKAPMSNVVVAGRRPGEAGETQVFSDRSEVKHVAALPVTDDEALYRRRFVTVLLPFLSGENKSSD